MSERWWEDKKLEMPWGATVTIQVPRPVPLGFHTHSSYCKPRYVEPRKKK